MQHSSALKAKQGLQVLNCEQHTDVNDWNQNDLLLQKEL
jgi:hypothetical protein